jgi:hypothetical protein
MKTLAEVLEAVKNGRKSECIDGRDYSRLVRFFPLPEWGYFDMELREGAEIPVPTEWTEANVVAQLKEDVEFGFEKALDKRGISSSMMHEVVKMWMWVLDDELQNLDNYPQYGLPFFKAVAIKYGFPNPIGDDDGDEGKYS